MTMMSRTAVWLTHFSGFYNLSSTMQNTLDMLFDSPFTTNLGTDEETVA